jgi:hypothetical protein
MRNDKPNLNPNPMIKRIAVKADCAFEAPALIGSGAFDYETQVAKEQMKYDFEAIDTGAAFTLRLLLTIRKDDLEKDYETLLKMILGALKSDDVAFGAKTTRGFGRVKCLRSVKREFVLSAGNRDALKDRLSFLEYDEATKSDGWTRPDAWEEADTVNFSSEYAVRNIREY